MTNFETQRIERVRNQAHISALKAEKYGKTVIKQVLKMIDKGIDYASVHSLPIQMLNAWGLLDSESTSLALNAQLKSRGIDDKKATIIDNRGFYDSGPAEIKVIEEIITPHVPAKKKK